MRAASGPCADELGKQGPGASPLGDPDCLCCACRSTMALAKGKTGDSFAVVFYKFPLDRSRIAGEAGAAIWKEGDLQPLSQSFELGNRIMLHAIHGEDDQAGASQQEIQQAFEVFLTAIGCRNSPALR